MAPHRFRFRIARAEPARGTRDVDGVSIAGGGDVDILVDCGRRRGYARRFRGVAATHVYRGAVTRMDHASGGAATTGT
jgi:hypothetical protein